jgi:hypothetical protein
MEHVIADLLFIFRLQNLTQEVEIYYIGSVLDELSLVQYQDMCESPKSLPLLKINL